MGLHWLPNIQQDEQPRDIALVGAVGAATVGVLLSAREVAMLRTRVGLALFEEEEEQVAVQRQKRHKDYTAAVVAMAAIQSKDDVDLQVAAYTVARINRKITPQRIAVPSLHRWEAGCRWYDVSGRNLFRCVPG